MRIANAKYYSRLVKSNGKSSCSSISSINAGFTKEYFQEKRAEMRRQMRIVCLIAKIVKTNPGF